jgi:hypothetical protein
MSNQESLDDFQTRFVSQFSKEQQEALFKLMLEKQATASNATSSIEITPNTMITPSTPPPKTLSKRYLTSPDTPHRGESRKVLIFLFTYLIRLLPKKNLASNDHSEILILKKLLQLIQTTPTLYRRLQIRDFGNLDNRLSVIQQSKRNQCLLFHHLNTPVKVHQLLHRHQILICI